MKLFKVICTSSMLVAMATSCSLLPQTTSDPPVIVQEQTQSPISETVPVPVSVSTDMPAPVTIDPADYQGWWTYNHPTYGFLFLLPDDWVVDESTTGDELMNGHLLILHSRYEDDKRNIRLIFREIGEEIPLWPTGVGSGEFLPSGTLDVAGQAVRRVLFVCPTGEVASIWYYSPDANSTHIQLGRIEFGIIFSGRYCEEGYSLVGKDQLIGEMIIASLEMQ